VNSSKGSRSAAGVLAREKPGHWVSIIRKWFARRSHGQRHNFRGSLVHTYSTGQCFNICSFCRPAEEIPTARPTQLRLANAVGPIVHRSRDRSYFRRAWMEGQSFRSPAPEISVSQSNPTVSMKSTLHWLCLRRKSSGGSDLGVAVLELRSASGGPVKSDIIVPSMPPGRSTEPALLGMPRSSWRPMSTTVHVLRPCAVFVDIDEQVERCY